MMDDLCLDIVMDMVGMEVLLVANCDGFGSKSRDGVGLLLMLC